MKLKLSSRYKLPIFVAERGKAKYEHYIWRAYRYPLGLLRLRKIKAQGFKLSDYGESSIINEWSVWKKEYMPPRQTYGTELLVDVGARDGDSAIFYFFQGFRNFRLIEPDPRLGILLLENADVMRKLGSKVEVIPSRFLPRHLDRAAFVKFDCEGCEYEVDLPSLKVPYVAEIHEKTVPNETGRYEYIRPIGYKRNF